MVVQFHPDAVRDATSQGQLDSTGEFSYDMIAAFLNSSCGSLRKWRNKGEERKEGRGRRRERERTEEKMRREGEKEDEEHESACSC